MITHITTNTFKQLVSVLSQLSDDQYSQKLATLNGSSIGGHVRHIIEFYDCLIEAALCGEVNYCKRERKMILEQSAHAALVKLQYLDTWLDVACKEDICITHASELGGEVVQSNTCMSRELVYLLEHNIHHFAIIGIALKLDYPDIEIPQDFGVAYSTIKYREAAHAESHHG